VSADSARAVLERHAAALASSPRVKRWAREALAALDDIDGPVLTVAAAIGVGLVFVISGYAMSSAGLRELLEELAREVDNGQAV